MNNRTIFLKNAIYSGLFLTSTLLAPSASAITYFGALSNFDVVNNSTESTNGFEIELEGVTSAQVIYTFEYQSYGKPRLIDESDSITKKPLVRVRYESKYNAATKKFNNSTPVAPVPTMQTAGHQCVSTPYAQNTSGCEHFGVSLSVIPSKTTYRWLVADTNHPGYLMYQLDPITKNPAVVSIPAPLVVINPPAPLAPVVVAPPIPVLPPVAQARVAPPVPQAVPPQPVVRMEIEVPEPPEVEEAPQAEYGKAMWVKMLTTENPEPVKLEDLLTGNDKIPKEEEVEVEWILLQKRLLNKDGKPQEEGDDLGKNQKLAKEDKPKDNITRRYEFYEYTGEFDEESNEATSEPKNDLPPEGSVGKYIGAQMVALNLFDTDNDNVEDTSDNCLTKPNPNQKDSDHDGFGNACDADVNNDFIVDAKDITLLRKAFFKNPRNANFAKFDLNDDGKIGTPDLTILKSYLKQAPGPGKAAEELVN